jgi:NAD(P)-dependent dehydrogenase (short-subunit alcohol dehydrogenase family)
MTMHRVLIVTGGGRGIGAATARAAAAAGYDLCVNYRRDRAAAEAVVADCTEPGRQAIAVQGDVANPQDVRRLFETAATTLGPPTHLVNNAGITGGLGRFEGRSPENLRRVMEVNVIGCMLCAQEAVRRMSTAHGGGGGVIVNVSSIAAVTGSPGEYVPYAASKAAVETFTVGLAREVAKEGIRVNAVAPGTVQTGIHAAGGDPDRPARVAAGIPLGRVATPAEIAAAILWLLSDQAAYATGTVLRVAGGL